MIESVEGTSERSDPQEEGLSPYPGGLGCV